MPLSSISASHSRRFLALVAVLVATSLRAQVPPPAPPPPPSQVELDTLAALPPYTPTRQVTGTVRLWGHGSPVLDFMGILVRSWTTGFARLQPGIHLEYDMHGTASAMGALYSGAGDIAILGQEAYPFEIDTFTRVRRYPPTEIEIATGSVDVRNFDFALGAFVNKTNPLTHLTLDQLDRIFTWHPGGPAANITTWGQLGLTGEWATRPIHLYAWPEEDNFSTFLERTAFRNRHTWRCGIQRFDNAVQHDGTILFDSGQVILDHVAADPDAIAFSNLRYLPRDAARVKELALGRSPAGPFFLATKQTVLHLDYPLARLIPALIDRAPGQPISPATREFLLYLLSRDGQGEIVRNGKYLPLNPALAAHEREKLQ